MIQSTQSTERIHEITIWTTCIISLKFTTKNTTKQSTSSRSISYTVDVNQGHLVNSSTLKTISIPVGICHINSRIFNAFKAMWRFLAVSLPFCIAGTRAAASAHSTVMAVAPNTKPVRSSISHNRTKCIYFAILYAECLARQEMQTWGLPAPANKWGPGNNFPALK